MESPPLVIEVTPNHEGTGAILHVNSLSDGSSKRWMEGEEASAQAKQGWLWKLGCLLKIHGNIECQCPHCSMENPTAKPLHADAFSNPWCYMLSDFPEGYKLFAVARPPQGDNQRKDYYLFGMFYPPLLYSLTDIFCPGGEHKYRSPQEFYPHLHWLYNNARGVKDPCICQYCDNSRSQEEINKIFYLPPHKESAKGPRGLKKNKQKGKPHGPKGVTIRRAYVVNRNSITSGPVISTESGRQEQKLIGYKTSHPFR